MLPTFLPIRSEGVSRSIFLAVLMGVFMGAFFLPGLMAGPKQRVKAKRTRTPKVLHPEELRGSKEERIRQNTRAINLGINQIPTERELLVMASTGEVVELKNNDHYYIDKGVPVKPWKKIKRVGGKKVVEICNPKTNKVFVYFWVKEYLDKFAADFFSNFKKKKKFKISSGARNLEEQKEMRTAGSCYYETSAAKVTDNSLEESLHVRAIAIDISRLGMSKEEINWMRRRLTTDKLDRVEFEIDPIEERSCYHIVVFPKHYPAN